jgi:HK97 family phage portal protein
MATPNPLRAAWDYLRGEDLKVQTPAPPPEQEPPGERKLFSFTTDSYDAVAQWVGPVVSVAFGGSYGAQWNSAVYACLSLICTSFQEAPLRVFRLHGDGSEEFENGHPLMALLDDPHPSLSQPEIMWWLEYAKNVHGNAYLRKIRSGARRVVQLWPLSPLRVTPHTSEEDRRRGVFLSHYRLDLGDGKYEEVPTEDMLHFRMGVDDRDHRLGLSPLSHLLREIASDEEATAFQKSLLHNYAVPGLAVQLPPGPVLTQEQATEIRNRLRDEYGGDGRGNIAVVANGATLQQIGFNPQQLDLKGAHEFPESRIAAVFGTPAMVVGLGIGLQRSTFSNYKEAREALFEQTIVPLWRADAATFRKQLLVPDFGATPDLRLKYDLNDVRALQEDQTDIYNRLSLAVEKGWLTKDEARAEVGFDPLPDGLGEAQDPMALLPAPGEDDEDDDAPPEERMRRVLVERKARALAAIPGMLDALHDLASPAMERDLEGYFRGQRARVTGRLKQQGG